MTDFEYDCLQKKRIARQALHRKNGSKSHRCPMSTDYMTEKQWKERNGKVVSVSFNKPTSWNNFKELSKETQEEYLRNLSTTYGANATNLAEMFDVSVSTIRRHIQSAGLDIKFHVGHSMNGEQRTAWDVFLGSAALQPIPQPEPATRREEPPEIHADTSMRMNKFSMSFSGDINVNMIANSLKHILGGNATGQVEIVCSLAEGAVEKNHSV